MVSIDYRPLGDEKLDFVIGGATVMCYTVEIIPDTIIEGNEEFTVTISTIPTDRISVISTTTIVIVDYNGELCFQIHATTCRKIMNPLHYSACRAAARECV